MDKQFWEEDKKKLGHFWMCKGKINRLEYIQGIGIIIYGIQSTYTVGAQIGKVC